MKEKTKAKLEEAYDYCEENEKSTGFMLTYLQDFANVDDECVMKFLETKGWRKLVQPKKED